jgi:hypothetical protein
MKRIKKSLSFGDLVFTLYSRAKELFEKNKQNFMHEISFVSWDCVTRLSGPLVRLANFTLQDIKNKTPAPSSTFYHWTIILQLRSIW